METYKIEAKLLRYGNNKLMNQYSIRRSLHETHIGKVV